MGTRGWNGLDNLSAAEVLELYRPDAAKWFRTTVDPEGLTTAGEDLDALGVELATSECRAPDDTKEDAAKAITYAAECALR